MERRRICGIVAVGVVFASGRPASAQQAPARAATAPAIDAVIEQRMAEAGIVGVGAAIVVDGNVAWTKGYGFADRERGVPFTPDTVMNIGSISKTVTGVAMMRAVQEGKLSLDADVNDYLPFKVVHPKHPAAKITLRQLATHTAGIADREAVYDRTYHFGAALPEPLGDFLASYLVPGGRWYSPDNFVDAKPGARREYSNIGAGLAGYVVERAVGERLDAYTREAIFAPLGMASTGWSLAGVDPARRARLYVTHDGLAIPIEDYTLTTYPDGGVRTSVADLAKLFLALLGGGASHGVRILGPRFAEEMLRFQFTPTNKPENVDLAELNSGLFWATKFNATRVGHNGSDPGVRTLMLANRERSLGVILFANTSVSGEAERKPLEIFLEVWKHAEASRNEAARVPAGVSAAGLDAQNPAR